MTRRNPGTGRDSDADATSVHLNTVNDRFPLRRAICRHTAHSKRRRISFSLSSSSSATARYSSRSRSSRNATLVGTPVCRR